MDASRGKHNINLFMLGLDECKCANVCVATKIPDDVGADSSKA